MNRLKRVRLQALGCRLNEAELEAWAEGFERRGLQVVPADAPADLIVLNTCAVTQEAVRKSRQILRKSHRTLPGARLVVSGCLASLDADALARELGVDLVVTNAQKDRLVELALDALDMPAMPELATTEIAGPLFQRGRQRAFVKAQDGCRYQCTFCVTTRARGEERSRPSAELVAAINRLHQGGIQEVVLTGVHLGGYGSDLGTDLGGLLREILAATSIPRIRLGSLEPWDLPDGFWSLMQDARLMPHLHLPAQSGSDVVLKRMARRCKSGDFMRLVERGRELLPDLNVTTDIIVGFPGETQADWQRTLDFAEAMQFGDIHVFSYSPRPGTLAASLPDRVDGPTKKARCRELKALAQRSRLRSMRAQIGKHVSLLCEGADGLSECSRAGYTPSYLPVHLGDAHSGVPGQILEVVLKDVDEACGLILATPSGGSGA